MSDHPWSNWSGLLHSSPQAMLAPASVEELQAIVRTAPGPVRATGKGHSVWPLVPSAGTIVPMTKLSKVTSVDLHLCRATAGGGMLIKDLAKALHETGQALVNMGDIDEQSIAGAIATATHGTGPTLGAYPTQIERIEIVDGRGGRRSYERQKDEEMLHAVGVSLGMFGIVSEVTIATIPRYRLRKRRFALPIEDMLANFQEMMQGCRSAEFFFVPFSGHAMFLASDITDEPVTARPPETDDDSLDTLRKLRNGFRRVGWLRRSLIRSALRKLPREDYVEDWLIVYANQRGRRFNEMEYHLPLEEGPRALAELIQLMEKHFPEIYFPVEVRTVAADDFWLSPFYKRLSCSIAIHHGADEDPLPFFRAAEPIFRRYGGRPHWGKVHSLGASELARLYPRWSEAMEVRRDIDPEGRFVTPSMAELLGID